MANWFGDPKPSLPIQVLISKDPRILGYQKISDIFVLLEHHSKPKWKWYLDSECSNNITRNKSLFKSVAYSDRGDINFGDNFKGKVIGIGTIYFNKLCAITNVYLVKILNDNLLEYMLTMQ